MLFSVFYVGDSCQGWGLLIIRETLQPPIQNRNTSTNFNSEYPSKIFCKPTD